VQVVPGARAAGAIVGVVCGAGTDPVERVWRRLAGSVAEECINKVSLWIEGTDNLCDLDLQVVAIRVVDSCENVGEPPLPPSRMHESCMTPAFVGAEPRARRD